MKNKTTEIALTSVFAGCVVLAIYLALYWSLPLVAVASTHNAKQAIKTDCARTQGCVSVFIDVGFSTEAGRPAYIAHFTLKAGMDAKPLSTRAEAAMWRAIESLPIPFRWIADERSVAVKVKYRD